ncbi:MAG: hypothetical protein HQ472_00595 [Ignavibacteria bacterium]|nr:hypothetical protein [Ignavibacteria bacterium]
MHTIKLFLVSVSFLLASLSVVSVLLFPSTDVIAQSDTRVNANSNAPVDGVKVLTRRVDSGAIVRWAPTSSNGFQRGLNEGYLVERAEADNSGNPITAFQNVRGGTTRVMPFDQDVFMYFAINKQSDKEIVTSYRHFAYSILFDSADAIATEDQEESTSMRYGLAMLAADRDTISAMALGLEFNDGEVQLGKRYVYRVSIGNPNDANYMLGQGTVASAIYQIPNRQALGTVVDGDTKVTIKWPIFNEFSGYLAERSSDNGATWTSLSDAPMITLITGDTIPEGEFLADTALENGVVYLYRIYGLTAFADQEMIGEYVGRPHDMTAPDLPLYVEADEISPGVVNIRWQFDPESIADIAAIYVAKSATNEGGYTRISQKLLATDTSYTDNSGEYFQTTFYAIQVEDALGNISESFPAFLVVADSTPTSKPELIKGTIDTNGVVIILFKPPSEIDYMGYRLLMANDTTHEFSVVLESFTNDSVNFSRDSIARDSIELNTLTSHVYYKMVALDYHHNESELSNMIQMRRPDIVPPETPVISGSRVTDSTVVLDIISSTSPDLAYQIIYRVPADSAFTDSIGVHTGETLSFVDATTALGGEYDYAVVAVDSAGNRSQFSNSVRAKRYDNGVRPIVTNVSAVYSAANKNVELKWDYPNNFNDVQFLVYKGEGVSLKSYAVVASATDRTFTDATAESLDSLRYSVKVVAASGAESALSPPVQVSQR